MPARTLYAEELDVNTDRKPFYATSLPCLPTAAPPARQQPVEIRPRRIAYQTAPAESHVAAFSLDGRVLAVGAETNTVLLIDPSTGRSLGRLGDDCSLWISCVTALSFSADGRRLASNGHALDSFERRITIWDLESGKEAEFIAGTREVATLALSPNGDRIALGLWDGTIEVRSTSTGREVLKVRAGQRAARVERLAFSFGGSALLTSIEGAGVTEIIEATTGACIRTIPGQFVGVLADNRVITSVFKTGDTEIEYWLCIWDALTGAFLDRVHATHPSALMSANGSRSAVVGRNSTEVWDWEHCRQLFVLEGARATAISANGMAVATGAEIYALPSSIH